MAGGESAVGGAVSNAEERVLRPSVPGGEDAVDGHSDHDQPLEAVIGASTTVPSAL